MDIAACACIPYLDVIITVVTTCDNIPAIMRPCEGTYFSFMMENTKCCKCSGIPDINNATCLRYDAAGEHWFWLHYESSAYRRWRDFQQFDGCGGIEVDVLGLVYVSEATRTQFAGESVVTQFLSYILCHIDLSFDWYRLTALSSPLLL